jgi:cold shock protein
VRVWHDAEGWGVVDSAETPGGCWVHVSHVLVPGYRALQAGQEVELEHEAPGQDGYAYRAVALWVMGAAPVEPTVGPPGAACTSTLTLTFDDDDEPR